jgi:flagellar hook assembly protein FlgD
VRQQSLRSGLAACCLASALLTATHLEATNVGGTINTDTTWTLAASPYVATSSVTVAAGKTLTIEPGVVVKFNSQKYIQFYGRVLALGTSASPIQFTSSQATPTAGYWGTVYFYPTASPQSQFSYVSFSYCGSSDGGCVVSNGASPALDNVTISNSSTAGLVAAGATASVTLSDSVVRNNTGYGVNLLTGATLTLTNTAFTDNTGYAIGAEAKTSLLGLTGLSLSGNGGGAKNYIYYRGGTITGAETWRAGATWLMGASTTVGTTSNATAQLTIEPGVRVEMGSHLWLASYGKLLAVGTSANPIQFTSSQASPTAGFWGDIYFYPSASPLSRLSYLTASYCGWVDGGCVVANGASPALDHVTISNSSTSGLVLIGAGASVALSDSTVRNNASYGVNVDNAASLTITDTSLTDNSGYALGSEANTKVLGLTGLTLSGNGGGTKNYIYYRGGTITGNETWKPGATWLMAGGTLVGSSSNSTAQLTIEPGTRVEAGYHLHLEVYGKLLAVGTSANRIQFTANSAAPAPGYWNDIDFYAGSSPESRIAYADISYCGTSSSPGGCVVSWGAAPTLDHVAISNSATRGFLERASGSPMVSNSSLTETANEGVGNWTPTAVFDARLNYWGASDGPSGSGSGSGEPVSTGALFAPWLAEAPTAPNYFASALQINRTFNPALSIFTRLDFTTAMEGDWTVTVVNSLGTTVRTLLGSGTSGSASWDGKNDSGIVQAPGTYSLRLNATASTSEVAAQARAVAILDNTRQLAISNVASSVAFISPNADGIQDSTVFSATFNFDDVAWVLDVLNAGSATVRSYSGNGGAVAISWDGRNGAGTQVPDGLYTLRLSASDGSASASAQATTTVDLTSPSTALTAPAATVLSNVYQLGVTDIEVVGTVTDLNFLNWALEYGLGAAPTSWTSIASGTTPISAGVLGVWKTLPITNGDFTLRVRAVDRAGNTSQATFARSIRNFSVSQSVLQANFSLGQSVNYVSVVPFALTETLVLKNRTGATVKTLVNAVTRSANSYTDAWTGLGDNGLLAVDGPYFYVATVTDGTNTLVWDLTNEFLPAWYQAFHNLNIQAFDPFNNQPATFTYNSSRTAVAHVAFGQNGGMFGIAETCDAPQFCYAEDEYQEAGSHTYKWAGVDLTGALRPDVIGVGVLIEQNTFSKNALVAFGSKPVVTNVKALPPVFGPAVGSQNIEFDLTTYQNQPAQVSVTFFNQTSLSTLRTITGTLGGSGHLTIPWDGRADNGMLVAPGRYTVTVLVTDARGTQIRGQILTTIQY